MGKLILLEEKRGGMKMSKRYSIAEIEEKATEILKQCKMDKQISIDPILVANELGIRVYAGSFRNPNMSGVIKKHGDDTAILVQKDHHINRQRFTIAHEIGHYTLHIDSEDLNKSDHVEYERSGTYTPKEEEANRFAAALLMPKEVVLKEYNECKILTEYTDILISFLSTKFGVSESAMRMRLSSLGLIDLGW